MKTIELSQVRRGLDEVLNLAGEENVVLTTPDGRQFVVAEIDDFENEGPPRPRESRVHGVLAPALRPRQDLHPR